MLSQQDVSAYCNGEWSKGRVQDWAKAICWVNRKGQQNGREGRQAKDAGLNTVSAVTRVDSAVTEGSMWISKVSR